MSQNGCWNVDSNITRMKVANFIKVQGNIEIGYSIIFETDLYLILQDLALPELEEGRHLRSLTNAADALVDILWNEGKAISGLCGEDRRNFAF